MTLADSSSRPGERFHAWTLAVSVDAGSRLRDGREDIAVGPRIAMYGCIQSRWRETTVMMPGGLLRPMGPSWTVYFRVGSSGQIQEILYLHLGCYQMRLDGRRTVGSELFD